MKKFILTLSALLVTTAMSLGAGSPPVQEAASITEHFQAGTEMPVEKVHTGRRHHKHLTKDACLKACTDRVTKAKEAAAKIVDAKHKTMADVHLANIENISKAYESYTDTDGKWLAKLDSMCKWSCEQIESLAKEDARHQVAEKKKADHDAKAAAKKAEHDMKAAAKHEDKKDAAAAKPEEKKDALPKAEDHKDAAKHEETKDAAMMAKPEEKK